MDVNRGDTVKVTVEYKAASGIAPNLEYAGMARTLRIPVDAKVEVEVTRPPLEVGAVYQDSDGQLARHVEGGFEVFGHGYVSDTWVRPDKLRKVEGLPYPDQKPW